MKKTLCLLLALFFYTFISSQETGCISGDCNNGYGTYFWSNGDKYVGNWFNKKMHGTGIYYFSNGDKYTGSWKNDFFDGYGSYYYKNGKKKTGYWANNEFLGQTRPNLNEKGCISGNCYNGYGTYNFLSGEKYEGYWINSKRNGFGTNYWVNGSWYKGEWKDDKRNGEGTNEYSNGDKYVGQWLNDKREGDGILYYANGKIENGYWVEGEYVGKKNTKKRGCVSGNCSNGHGTFIYSTGGKYVGDFKNGKRDGYGTYEWVEGDKYFGYWKNGLLNGKGLYHYSNGDEYDGMWKEHKRHGYGTITYVDGTSKSGIWKEGVYFGTKREQYGCISGDCENGYGVYSWKSGEKYEGNWKYKKRNGQGKNTWADGWIHDGEWKDDKRHGYGTQTSPSGVVKKGFWENDKYIAIKKVKPDSIPKNHEKIINNLISGNNNKTAITIAIDDSNKQQDSLNQNLEIKIIYPVSRNKEITLGKDYPIINSNYTEFIVDVNGGLGSKYVLINGQKATQYSDGHYYKNIHLKTGENIVEVFAEDEKGNKQNISTKIICTYETYIDVKGGEYYGIIIGINEYTDESLTDLDRPVLDAKKLKRLLEKKYTFKKENVLLLENPKRTDLINCFENISKKIRKQDNLLIFYAGHGFWDDEKKIGYWLPSNSNALVSENWFRNSTLKDFIKSINCKHTLLITDACFGGSIFKTRSTSGPNIHAYSKLYKLQSRKGMTSGALNKVPDNSIFVDYLIKRLEQNNEKYLPASKLFNSMRDAVLNNSLNVPQYGVIQDIGDEGGEFIFIRK